MLYYVATRPNLLTLGPFLLYYRQDLLQNLRLIPSDRIDLLREIEAGAVIWTDFDRYFPSETETAASVHRCLTETRPTVSHYNNPDACLQRFDLLRSLHDNGTNTFNVYRLHEAPRVKRYPVFIRRASGTTRRAPQLLRNAEALRLAVNAASRAHQSDLMIVELGNVRDDDGYFRKYGAYRVGNRIYPQHVVLSRDWYAKFPVFRGNPVQKLAQTAYFDAALDADTLMRVFSDARIDYGRIDYCLTERGLEVFEINTNPAVLSNPPTRFDRFDYVPWASRHADALLELDHVTTEENIALPRERAIRTTHESVVARLSRKLARRRARATARLAARRGTFAIATGLKGIVRNLRAPH